MSSDLGNKLEEDKENCHDAGVAGINNYTVKLDNNKDVIYQFYDCLKDDSNVELVSGFIESGDVNVNHIFNDSENNIDSYFNGRTALHFVAQTGKVKLMKCLLDLGADQSIKDNKGEIALHIACKHGQYDCAQLLLQYDNGVKDRQNKLGLTPLMKAIFRSEMAFKATEYEKTVDILISADCDTNICPESNMTALHYAAGTWQRTQLVKRLIAAGAEVNRNTATSSPLMTAISKNKQVNIETVQALINAGADVNYKNPSTKSVLHVAVAKSLDICVKDLLAAGADPKAMDRDGIAPIRVAVCENNISIAPLLLKYGADVNYCHPQYNMSLLCRAAFNGNKKMVQLLLDHSADVDIRTNLGASPIHYAVDNNNLDIVRLLLNKNCSLERYTTFKDRYTPMNLLQLALHQGDDDMIRLLMSVGVPVLEEDITLNDLPRLVREDEELVAWIYNHFYNPQSLQHLCRVDMRQQYGTDILNIVETLVNDSQIPRRLADFVIMTDLLSDKKRGDDYDDWDYDDY